MYFIYSHLCTVTIIVVLMHELGNEVAVALQNSTCILCINYAHTALYMYIFKLEQLNFVCDLKSVELSCYQQ